MKKLMATLLFMTMVFTGCGNNAANDAKQKVEQKAEEVKQDAKDAASKVEEKAAEVKNDAAQVAQDAGNAVSQRLIDIVDATRSFFSESREVPLAGILPGITLEKVIEVFGEPAFRDGDEVTFSNGVEVEVDDDNNTVEKVVVRTADIATPEGVAVGMGDYVLNDAYGPADNVDVDADDGKVEYQYYSGDKVRSIEFTARDGVITEIESKIRD